MGFRFRKSVKVGPFRMTASKSGLSASVGGKGARITKTASGKTRARFSIPGTGIGYTVGGGRKKRRGGSRSGKVASDSGGGLLIGLFGLLVVLLCIGLFVVLLPVALAAVIVYAIYSYLKIPKGDRPGFGSHIAGLLRGLKDRATSEDSDSDSEEVEP